MKNDLAKIDSHTKFERFCSSKGLEPMGKAALPHGEVCVAECFVTPKEAAGMYDLKLGLQVPKSVDHPRGYYQTFWLIMRGKADIGQWLEFDALHDPEMTESARKQARFNTAVRVAEDFMRNSAETGRYAAEEIGDRIRKRRVTSKDFRELAEYVITLWEGRKARRKNLDKCWQEIDRQLRMEPDLAFKRAPNGQIDRAKAWMPEIELPMQAQTLEVLVADSRRMKFPDSGPWFQPTAALTDEYLERVDFAGLIAGDENDVPSRINQDNANNMVAGMLRFFEKQYDFAGHMDQIDGEAFKYGCGIGRARMVTKRVFMRTAKGMASERRTFPMLVPRSVRSTYLDDSMHALSNEGHVVGPSYITESVRSIADLRLAADKGSSDPDSESGGWMAKSLTGIDGDKNGNVTVLEYEGDLVIPRKTTGSLYIPGAIALVLLSPGKAQAEKRLVRLRFRKTPWNSHIEFPYHHESLETPYATSPLMKGRPIQAATVEAMRRLMEASALHTQPPIGYDRDDSAFSQSGGPRVYPGANWPTTDPVTVHRIGDPAAMFQVYVGLLSHYADVTGVHAPRLGAQTLSHTTAFAKQAELSRGTVRTVDYVRSSLKGPMTQWLYYAYQMGRDKWQRTDVLLENYRGYVSLTKDALPETVHFEANGAGQNQEQNAKMEQRLQSAQLALQIEQLAIQLGQMAEGEGIDKTALIEQTLMDGGWTDLDAILRRSAVPAGIGVGSPLEFDTGETGLTGELPAALAAG